MLGMQHLTLHKVIGLRWCLLAHLLTTQHTALTAVNTYVSMPPRSTHRQPMMACC